MSNLRTGSHISSFPKQQTGAALLLFILVLVLGASTLLVSKLNKAASQSYRDDQTMRALLKAKEALVGWAVTYSDSNAGEFGFLPCPDMIVGGIAPEGASDGACNGKNISALGKFPWNSLEIEPIRDSSGECLWYAVSGQYKNVAPLTKTDMLNEDSNGYFVLRDQEDNTSLAGVVPDNRAVALIIAPGSAIGNQDRTSLAVGTEVCGGNYTANQYLDCYDQATGNICTGATAPANRMDNSTTSAADTIDTFITGKVKGDPNDNAESVNDRVIAITRAEIFDAVQQRNDFLPRVELLTRRLAQCVAGYGTVNGFLPWAAPVNLGATDYRLDDSYDDLNGLNLGRLPDDIDNSGAAQANMFDPLNCAVMTPDDYTFWRNWKDHFFYQVSIDFDPASAASCTGNCLETPLSPPDEYAAVVIFSGTRTAAPAQTRNSPHTTPADTDTKLAIGNYLENGNEDGDTNFNQSAVGTVTGDILYCIEDNLTTVLRCP